MLWGCFIFDPEMCDYCQREREREIEKEKEKTINLYFSSYILFLIFRRRS